MLLAIGGVMLVSRVNFVLVDLLSQLAQIAAAVGRMLILMVAVIVLGSILLFHI